MREVRLHVVVGICLFGLVVTASAQQVTTTEIIKFEVVSVEGNKLVAKRGDGTSHEYTVPEDFRFNVEGREVSVHELQPGMKGTATITTRVTTTPVKVTEVRNAEVMQVAGNTIIVRGENGIRRFTEGDATKRGVTIIKDGRPVTFSELRVGDKLTATIITEGTPAVMTERQVQAAITGQTPAPAAPSAQPPAPAPTPAPAPAPTGTSGTVPAAPAEAPSEESAAKTLPKTASLLPLVGVLGAASLAVGMALTAIRRRRASR